MEFLDVSIATQFLFDQLKITFDRSKITLDRSKVTFDQSKFMKQDFSVEFFSDCSERLKRFQAL